MHGKISLLTTVLTVLAAVFSFMTQARAATETVLYSFKDLDDGMDPVAPVLPLNGKLYGTTTIGGAHDLGTVFELANTKSGWMKTTLHDFTGLDDGEEPWAGLVADRAGNLYGSCANAGKYGHGVIFEVSPHGARWVFSPIHAFTGGDGSGPTAALTFDGRKNLYGTTTQGGGCGGYGCGTVFQLSPTKRGWKLTTLHDFNGTDGSFSQSPLYRDARGNFYGTTDGGGRRDCNGDFCGTVFELSPSRSGWKFAVLHKFNGADGNWPLGALIMDESGSLYGTTGDGGIGYGVAYRLAPASGKWKETVLHVFLGGSDGDGPGGGVVFDSQGNLYGTTDEGGSDGAGAIFELTRSGKEWQESVPFSFDGSDGFLPEAGLVGGAGGFYSTTEFGGGYGIGTVFEFVP